MKTTIYKSAIKILVCLYLIIFSNCAFRYHKYALYGKVGKESTDASINICFDRFGDIYPEFEINDSQLRKNYAALDLFFEGNTDFKNKLLKAYPTKDSSFVTIQSLIVKEKANEINTLYTSGRYNSITFIMVGYNNAYDDANDKLSKLKTKIEDHLKNGAKKTLVIKLFWDGTKNNLLPGVSYGNSAAYYSGLGLRQLLSEIKPCNNIKMISHSLGANLICETLFNQDCKVTDVDGVKTELNFEYKRKFYKTPTQNITVALVAPAMPGECTFIDYTFRTTPFTKETDNYKVIIGFNSNDFALKKVFGGGFASHLSSTTLGQSLIELNNVAKIFADLEVPQNFSSIDFSIIEVNGVKKTQNKHDLIEYMNTSQYDELLKRLFTD